MEGGISRSETCTALAFRSLHSSSQGVGTVHPPPHHKSTDERETEIEERGKCCEEGLFDKPCCMLHVVGFREQILCMTVRRKKRRSEWSDRDEEALDLRQFFNTLNAFEVRIVLGEECPQEANPCDGGGWVGRWRGCTCLSSLLDHMKDAHHPLHHLCELTETERQVRGHPKEEGEGRARDKKKRRPLNQRKYFNDLLIGLAERLAAQGDL
jgi:hypothetical protein